MRGARISRRSEPDATTSQVAANAPTRRRFAGEPSTSSTGPRRSATDSENQPGGPTRTGQTEGASFLVQPRKPKIRFERSTLACTRCWTGTGTGTGAGGWPFLDLEALEPHKDQWDAGRVPDRQRGRIDLLAVVLGQPGGQYCPELLERAPQPAGPPVGLALVRQHREQVAPVPPDLGQEPGLAAPAQQVPDLRDRQQLGIGAGRGRPPGGAGS